MLKIGDLSKMEPRIVTKAEFTVVGLPFAGLLSAPPYEGSHGKNEISLVWEQMQTRYGEIRHVSGPAIGLCFGMPNAVEPWYLAGHEVSRVEDLPAGMMSMTVPTQKYAVFPCTLGTIGATYRYITEDWQPVSGSEHAAAPDFEYYDEGPNPDGPPQDMPLKIYWPIK